MFGKTLTLLVTAAALASTALAAVPGVAAEPQIVRTVKYADLDLESLEGRAQLERRLWRAVKSLCATGPVAGSSAVREAQARCEMETARSMEAQMAAAVRANRARATAYASH